MLWEPTKDPDRYVRLTVKEIDCLTFEAQVENASMIFLGNETLMPKPVFEFTPKGGRRLNLVQSKAIQFVPSALVERRVLLEGRMAIMRKSDYQLDAIPWEPIVEWFRSVSQSFKDTIGHKGAILIQNTTLGTVKEWHQVMVSQDAVNWRRTGGLLKQFPRGEVEFDVKLSRPG